MLNVIFGRENLGDRKYVLDTRIYFSRNKKPEWFENDFVKAFLMDVDGTTVLFEEALKDVFGHGISTEMISTGCKTLCDIYYCTDTKVIFYGSAMGNNCYPFLLDIAREREVWIFLEHYPLIDDKYFDEGLIFHNGKALSSFEFDCAYSDWCASTREEAD